MSSIYFILHIKQTFCLYKCHPLLQLMACSHIPPNICCQPKFLLATYQSKHGVVVCHARWMGLSDLCNICSYWSTIKKHLSTIRQNVAPNVANIVSKCEQVVSRSTSHLHIFMFIKIPIFHSFHECE